MQPGSVPPPRCPAVLLLVDPSEDGMAPITAIATELDAGEIAGTRVLTHPPHRDCEELSDFACGEETVGSHPQRRFVRRRDYGAFGHRCITNPTLPRVSA